MNTYVGYRWNSRYERWWLEYAGPSQSAARDSVRGRGKWKVEQWRGHKHIATESSDDENAS